MNDRIGSTYLRKVCFGLALISAIGLANLALPGRSLAAPDKKASFPSFCPDFPDNLRKWFKANGEIFTEDLNRKRRPKNVRVCYKNDRIFIFGLWEIGKFAVKKESHQGIEVWESEFFIYIPTQTKLIFALNNPYSYFNGVMVKYWLRNTSFPPKTIWIIELRNSRSEWMRMVYVDQGGILRSTGEVIVKVGNFEKQTFQAEFRNRSHFLTSPRTLAGELTQEGLVYQFFDLPDK